MGRRRKEEGMGGHPPACPCPSQIASSTAPTSGRAARWCRCALARQRAARGTLGQGKVLHDCDRLLMPVSAREPDVWAVSSAGEHRPYKPGVAGSIPAPPIAAIAASRLTFPAARLRDLHLALGLGAGSGAGSFLGRAGEALHGVELVAAVSSTSFLPARGASQRPFCHLAGRPGRGAAEAMPGGSGRGPAFARGLSAAPADALDAGARELEV